MLPHLHVCDSAISYVVSIPERQKRLEKVSKRSPLHRHLVRKRQAVGRGISPLIYPKVTHYGSTESFDRELSNDVLTLVCGEVWVA